MSEMSSDSSDEGSEDSTCLQCDYSSFEFLTNGDDKLDCLSMQQWIKHAKIPDITEDDVKKYFGKDGGLDINEYGECVEKLAKEKKRDTEHILEDLVILFLMCDENQSLAGNCEMMLNSVEKGGEDHTFCQCPVDLLQASFKIFTLCNKDGKLDCPSMQQWIKNPKIPDITEDDVKKFFGKDGGLDSIEFEESVEKLAMEKKRDKEKILQELEVFYMMFDDSRV